MSFFRRNKTNSTKHNNRSLGNDKPITIQAALALSVGKTRMNMEDAASSLVWEQGFREDIKRWALYRRRRYGRAFERRNGELDSDSASQCPFGFSLQDQSSEAPTIEEVQNY